MKLRDHIFDPDRKIATIWLEEIDHEQLENLLILFKAKNTEPKTEFDFDSIIFSEET